MKRIILTTFLLLLISAGSAQIFPEIPEGERKFNIKTTEFNEMIKRKQELEIVNTLCYPMSVPEFHVSIDGKLAIPSNSVFFVKNIKLGHIILYKDANTGVVWLVKEFNLTANKDDIEYILREINIGLKVTNTMIQMGNGPFNNLIHIDRCYHDKAGNYNYLYAFYPYYEKGSLNDYIDQHRKEFSTVSFSWKFEIMEKIAEGVKVLSFANTGHRDIKPQNIMMSSHTQPIIIDYGLSKKFEDQSNDVKTVAGTLRYIAPEVFDSRYGVKADVYSLGLVFFELLNNFSFRSVEDLKLVAKDYCKNIPQSSVLIAQWEKHTYCTKFEPLILSMIANDPDQRIDISLAVSYINEGKALAAEEDKKWYQSLRSFPFINMLTLYELDKDEAKLLQQVIDWLRKSDQRQSNQNNQLII